jgi:type I restriction enzyme S subunit
VIDLSPDQRQLVETILATQAPEWDVLAFGSRTTGRATAHSDLDLAVASAVPVDWRAIERLKDAFADSDLPFSVDVVDLARTAPAFADRIRRDGVWMRHADRFIA